MGERRRGVRGRRVHPVGAFPAFFGLLEFTTAVEVLVERILWTLVVVLIVLLLAGRIRELLDIDRLLVFTGDALRRQRAKAAVEQVR